MGTHPLTLFRQARGLNQVALSALLGVSRATVSRWESGLRKIDDDQLPKVSHKTGIPRRDLRPDLAELLEPAE